MTFLTSLGTRKACHRRVLALRAKEVKTVAKPIQNGGVKPAIWLPLPLVCLYGLRVTPGGLRNVPLGGNNCSGAGKRAGTRPVAAGFAWYWSKDGLWPSQCKTRNTLWQNREEGVWRPLYVWLD